MLDCRALRVVNPSPYMIYLQARGSIPGRVLARDPVPRQRGPHGHQPVPQPEFSDCSSTPSGCNTHGERAVANKRHLHAL